MKRLRPVLAAALAALSCSATPNLLPVNDLNRPTDVTFMCFGAYDPTGAGTQLTVSGRPMRACHPPDFYDPPASTTSRTFAFLPNSGSSGLTAIDADHWKLVDLDPFTGGYGMAPLGKFPSQISSSDDGCRLVTANRGSCDLSLVDPSVLVAPTFYGQQSHLTTLPSPRTATMTIRPVKGDGTFLTAAPYEAVFLPQDTSQLVSTAEATDPTQTGPLCNPDGAMADPIGWPAQAKPAPWYVLVTYPSCDLIAVVALPGGQIVSSAHVRPTGDGEHKSVTLIDAGTSPSCPVDCVGQDLPPGTTDSGGGGGVGPTVADAGAGGQGGTTPDAGVSDGGGAAATDASQTGPLDGSRDGSIAGAAGGVGGSAGAPSGAAGSPSGGAGGAAGRPAFPGNQYANTPYVPATQLSPSGIAIVPDGSRAYVGLANASYVLSFGLTSAGLSLPGHPILLNEGARGATRVRLNVDQYRYVSNAGQAGVFVGAEAGERAESLDEQDANGMPQALDVEKRRYLYAVAQDGTVRVINVFLPGAEVECETNIDPMNLPAGVTANTACIPVDPVHRRPFSVGPGIHLPSLPIDVAAADVRTEPTEDTSEQSVNGAHAWIITASGVVYLVNINPVLRKHSAALESEDYSFSALSNNVTEPEPFVNTLRDRNEITYSVTLDPSSGPPRVDVLPSVPATGPYLEPFWTQGSKLNATALTRYYVQTGVFFPQEPTPANPDDPIDRRAVTPQEWTITWQGALGGTRSTGVLLGTESTVGRFPSNAGTRKAVDSMLLDNGTNYCGSGVVNGDLITLTGCTQNSQCGPGEVCLLDATGSGASAGLPINGLCADPNRFDATAAACASYLQTVRRYRIVASYPNQVVIRPNLDELPRSALTRCDPSANGDLTDTTLKRCKDPADPSTDKFTCVADPEGGATPRCLQVCNLTTPCRAGRVCISLDADPTQPPDCDKNQCFCADAPPLTDAAKTQCFDQLISYQVQVGNGFLVSGSQSGFQTTAPLPSGSDQCDPHPTPDSRFAFRIPMDAPTCTNLPADVSMIDSRVDPDTYDLASPMRQTAAENSNKLVQVATSTPTPDPCLYVGGPVQGDPLQPMGTPPQHVRALFRNAQIEFVLANLDRGPTGQFVSVFDVHGGFNPQVVQDPVTVEVSMPARIVFGPVDAAKQLAPFTDVTTEQRYLFVVDQRRLGREQGGAATRGQLLRINPLGYTSTVGSATGLQPIFEDYNTSGGVFPIQ
ncbi:MAG: hypothetical protein ACJ8F1_05335 [Polyangia bacterium]